MIRISEELANQRIDIALSKASEYSRSMIQKLIHANKIKCDDVFVQKANQITALGQIYYIEKPEENIEHISKEKGELEILFEDDDIVILNKSAHSIVHPGAGHASGTLMNHLAYYVEVAGQTLSDYNGPERIGVVHRLDKGVSGCIIFAKNNISHMKLNEQFQNRSVQKEYIALCYGNNIIPKKQDKIFANSGTLEDYIARGTHDRKKMVCTKYEQFSHNVSPEEIPNIGKHATMDFKIEESIYSKKNLGFISKIKCMPHTGRMHQIRVQLSSRKMPIIGDKLYGNIFGNIIDNKENKELCEILGNRIALHAAAIKFIHPTTNQELYIQSAVPEVFEKMLDFYRNM